MKTTENIVGVKELRNNLGTYINKAAKGESFTVVRRSRPVFRITPADEDEALWETIIDFTKIKKGGVPLEKVLSALKKK